MKGERKTRRHSKDDSEDVMIKITFKVDQKTLSILEKLEKKAGLPDIRGRRSIVLRRIIHAARK